MDALEHVGLIDRIFLRDRGGNKFPIRTPPDVEYRYPLCHAADGAVGQYTDVHVPIRDVFLVHLRVETPAAQAVSRGIRRFGCDVGHGAPVRMQGIGENACRTRGQRPGFASVDRNPVDLRSRFFWQSGEKCDHARIACPVQAVHRFLPGHERPRAPAAQIEDEQLTVISPGRIGERARQARRVGDIARIGRDLCLDHLAQIEDITFGQNILRPEEDRHGHEKDQEECRRASLHCGTPKVEKSRR